MKRTQLRTQINATLVDLRRHFRSSSANFVNSHFGGFQKLHDYLDLTLFDYRKRKNAFADMVKTISSALPPINLSPTIGSHLGRRVDHFVNSEVGDEPIDQWFIGGRNNQVCAVPGISSGAFGVGANGKASLSIDDSRHVGQNRGLVFFFHVLVFHKLGLTNVCMNVKNNINKAEPQRLSERARTFFVREAIV